MRRDSGIYQCRPLEADSLPDVKGEMQLTVHCEEPSLKHNRVSLTSYNANMFNMLAFRLPELSDRRCSHRFLLSDGLVWLCADLDPAVVVPKDSEFMLRGEDLTATCNALSSLKTSTVWYKVSSAPFHPFLMQPASDAEIFAFYRNFCTEATSVWIQFV